MTVLEYVLNDIDRRMEEQRETIRDCERVLARLAQQRQEVVDEQKAALAGVLPKNGGRR